MTPNIKQGANLPHWTSEGAVYAVTIRLADSMPQEQLEEWKHEREFLRKEFEMEGLTAYEFNRLIYLHSEKLQEYLDAGYGTAG